MTLGGEWRRGTGIEEKQEGRQQLWRNTGATSWRVMSGEIPGRNSGWNQKAHTGYH